jgi:hypothetical protein
MLGNIAVEMLVGAVPVAGDVFDFLWQSNSRNLLLVERAYHPRINERPGVSVAVFFGAVILAVVASAIGVLWLAILLVKQVIGLF